MNISRFKIYNSTPISLIILICLFSVYPFTFSQFLPIPSVTVVACLSLLIVSLILLNRQQITLLPKLFNQIVLLQIIGWVLFLIIHKDSTYLTRIFFVVLSYQILLLLQNCHGGIRSFTKMYDKVITIMAICGCICFFLILFFNISPFLSYINMDGRPGWLYGLTCTNTRIGNIIRYSGFFDEPGAMAFWGMYTIVINEIFFKNKFVEIVLPIALFFTFSIAFYIQYTIFFFLFKIKTSRQALLLCLIMVIIGVSINHMKDSEYEIVYEMTFGRFEYDEKSGSIKGDNRSELSQNAKKVFCKSPLIGNGPKIVTQIEQMSDNPYENLATDGIIGSGIMYLPLLLIFIICKQKKVRYGIIILFLGYLQRPFHTNLIHTLFLYLFTLLVIIDFQTSNGKLFKNHRYNRYI